MVVFYYLFIIIYLFIYLFMTFVKYIKKGSHLYCKH